MRPALFGDFISRETLVTKGRCGRLPSSSALVPTVVPWQNADVPGATLGESSRPREDRATDRPASRQFRDGDFGLFVQ
jgi:hypothetical protein